MKMVNRNIYAVIIITLFTVAACSYSQKTSELKGIDTPPQTLQASETGEGNYILQVGDELEIKFYNETELNEKVTIRPDGGISLQFIDDVKAAGLTPSELDKILTERYESKLKKPEVAVIVKTFSAQKIYIGGEVVFPQLITLQGRLTALQAIYMAGGFKESGQLSNVLILRNPGSQKSEILEINFKKIVKNETPDIYLKPYDIVYIPKTFIAQADKFVDQYINQIIPRNIGFSFPFIYELNRPKSSSGGIKAQVINIKP